MELKFRAWDKIDGIMWTCGIAPDGVPLANGLLGGYTAMDGELLDPIMQFTGLTDKNGKDIYEGDILGYKRLNFNIGTPLEIRFCVDGLISVMGFHAYIDGCLFDSYGGIPETNLYYEIIGNIHQRPELMGKGNNND